MTEFQKEIGIIVVLLGFFLGYFVYVETVQTGIAGRSRTAIIERMGFNEDAESGGVSFDINCGW